MTMETLQEIHYSEVNITCCDVSNMTSPTADPNTKPFRPFWSSEVIIQVVTVMIVMITTVIGNTVLIYMLAYKKSRRIKRVNVFIINLAIADLAVAFITMTTEILFAAFREWVLGAFLCKLTVYFQVVALSSTTFLLTGMSIDRYQVIVKPLKSLAQRPKISTKVVVAWLMACVFAIPQCIIFGQEESVDSDKGVLIKKCRSGGYSAEWQRKLYFTFLTFYILVIPSGTMLYCYSSIVRTIFNRGDKDQHYDKSSSSVGSPRMTLKRSVISSSRRRVVVMTLSVILAFIVCLTPYFIISLIRIYSNYSLALIDELSVSKIIFMLHSALNPILYGLFTLRKEHLSGMFVSFCNKNNLRRNKDGRSLRNEPKCNKFRRGLLFLKKGSRGETSVIIASHAAREESHLMLKNRQYRKSVSFRPLPVYNQSQTKADRGAGNACNNHNHSTVTGQPFSNHALEAEHACNNHVTEARSNCVVSVHHPITPDSGTDVSEV